MADEKKMDNLDMVKDISTEVLDAVSDAEIDEVKLAKKQRRRRLIKTAIMLIFSLVILIFAAIAWFMAGNRVDVDGMQVKLSAMNFELKSVGDEGLYDDYISRVDSDYTSATQTGPSTSKIILHLTNSSQIENLWQGSTPPTQSDKDRIKRIESTEYGLSPGDHGTLKFRIVPTNGETVNVLIKPEITCYRTEYYSAEDTEHTPGYQKDVFEPMDPEDAQEGLAIAFAKTHINLFYMADEDDDNVDEMHLITDEGFLVSDISTEKEVTLYWVWPEELSNILEKDIEGMDTNGATELRKDFFATPDNYLEKINETDDFSDIVIPASSSESARNAKAQDILESTTSYNFYSNRYNNADQTIGDRVGYIMLEIAAQED